MTQYGVTIKSGSKMAAILDTPSWIFFILVEPLKFAKIDQKVTEDNKRTR